MKLKPFPCEILDCPRRINAFTRKDNLQAHLREVHGVSSKDDGGDETAGNNQRRQEPPDNSGRIIDNLVNCSREELLQMVQLEQEKRRLEESKREQAENELAKLRQRFDEREDMWLTLISRR